MIDGTPLVDHSAYISVSVENRMTDSEMIPKSILKHNTFPMEFVDSENEINIPSYAEGIVKMIGDKAREIILNSIARYYTGIDLNGVSSVALANQSEYGLVRIPGRSAKLSELPKNNDFQVINQKSHKFPLTQSMAKLGWQQMMAKVSLITREKADELYPDDSAKAKAVYKSMRYPVHMWVSPHVLHDQANHKNTRGIIWGKIKMEGKRPLWPKS